MRSDPPVVMPWSRLLSKVPQLSRHFPRHPAHRTPSWYSDLALWWKEAYNNLRDPRVGGWFTVTLATGACRALVPELVRVCCMYSKALCWCCGAA